MASISNDLLTSALQGRKRKAQGGAVKGSTQKKARLNGALKNITEIPLDLLFEIFSLLEPLDLLRLSWSTKALRSIVMNGNARCIWKCSFENIEPPLPDCPDGLTEPAFAELLFGKGCSFCDKKTQPIHIISEYRVRSCSKCLQTRFTKDLIVCAYGSFVISPPVYSTWQRNRRVRYRLLDSPLNVRWRQEFSALAQSGHSKQLQWHNLKVQEVRALTNHGDLCESWLSRRERHVSGEQEAASKIRRTAFVDHLRSLGWGDEIDKLKNGNKTLEGHCEIQTACKRPLSGPAMKRLEESMVEHLQGVQRARLQKERLDFLHPRLVALNDVYDKYLATLPPLFMYPMTVDVFQFSGIQDVINNSLTPELTQAEHGQLQALFPQAQQAWLKSVRRQLLDMINGSGEGSLVHPQNVDESRLDEPLAFFFCSGCIIQVAAPDMPWHPCARRIHGIIQHAMERQMTTEDKAVRESLSQLKWNAGGQFKVLHDEKDAVSLLRLLHPDSDLSLEHLNDTGTLIECLACNHETSGRYVMKWNSLATHLSKFKAGHMFAQQRCYRLVHESEASTIRARIEEERAMKLAQSGESRHTMCGVCRLKDSYTNLLNHLRSKHSVVSPKMGRDIITNTSYGTDYHRVWPPLSKEEVDALVCTTTS